MYDLKLIFRGSFLYVHSYIDLFYDIMHVYVNLFNVSRLFFVYFSLRILQYLDCAKRIVGCKKERLQFC